MACSLLIRRWSIRANSPDLNAHRFGQNSIAYRVHELSAHQLSFSPKRLEELKWRRLLQSTNAMLQGVSAWLLHSLELLFLPYHC